MALSNESPDIVRDGGVAACVARLMLPDAVPDVPPNVIVLPAKVAKLSTTFAVVVVGAWAWMWLAEEFAVRPLKVMVQVRTFVVGFRVPVHVPVAVEFTPADVPLASTSFDAARFALYVMFAGAVGLSLPQATINAPPISAVASVNTRFCIGMLPRLGWAVRNRYLSSGNGPRCSSGLYRRIRASLGPFLCPSLAS
jgi:hypothetical protein